MSPKRLAACKDIWHGKQIQKDRRLHVDVVMISDTICYRQKILIRIWIADLHKIRFSVSALLKLNAKKILARIKRVGFHLQPYWLFVFSNVSVMVFCQ